MKKQLKPARRKGFGSAGKNEEIIDLKHTAPEAGSDQEDEDVLDLTHEVSSKTQTSLDDGIIELTETTATASSVNKDADLKKDSSNNVIHLSGMASSLSLGGSDEVEDLSDEGLSDLDDDEDLAQLTQQLESAIAGSYDDDEDDDEIEKLPDANLLDLDSYSDDSSDELDHFKLLPEAEPGMADNFDSIDLPDLNDNTFADFEDDLTEQMTDLSMTGNKKGPAATDTADEDISESAVELNRAMEADRLDIYPDKDDELSDDLKSIRNKLDLVFPEDDSTDPLTVFDSADKTGHKDELDFNPDELVLPPFDENESGAAAAPFRPPVFESGTPSFDAKAKSFDGDINFYGAKAKSPQKKSAPPDAGTAISNTDVEAAIMRLIETKYAQKIEQMIAKAIEKAVTREIAKIKRIISDQSGRFD